MFFQEDYTAQEPEENLAEKTGGRRFLWVLGQETAAVLKLNLLFLLCCLPVVTIPPALLALHRSVWTLAAGSLHFRLRPPPLLHRPLPHGGRRRRNPPSPRRRRLPLQPGHV